MNRHVDRKINIFRMIDDFVFHLLAIHSYDINK